MGNIHTSDRSLLFLVERPLVIDLQPDESVVVDLNIHNQEIRLDDWDPSRPMLLPLPIADGIRGTVSAEQKDADEEPDMRAIGHFMIPAEAASILEEPVCQVFLGLLTDEEVETLQDQKASAKAAFEASYAAAKTPGRSKVSIMFAVSDSGMQDWSPEDMWSHLRKLQEQPAMRLLRHSHSIITELSLSESKAAIEVACNHREFAAKENLYQGFVQSARVQKVAMMEKMALCGNKFTAMLAEEMQATDITKAFFEWYKVAMGSRYDAANKRLMRNKSWLKKLCKEGMGKDIIYAKLCWEFWKKSFVYDEFKGSCEVQFVIRGVDYDRLKAHHQIAQELEMAVAEVCSAESHQMFLPDDMKMHVTRVGSRAVAPGDVVTSLFDFDFLEESERVKRGDEGILTELQADGRAHIQFAHTRLIMSQSQFARKSQVDEVLPVEDGSISWKSKGSAADIPAPIGCIATESGVRVFGNIKSSKDFFGAQVCAMLEKEPSFTGKLLETRLQGVPGIFAACSGPLSIDNLKIGFVRSAKGQRVREGMCAALDALVSRCDVHTCLFDQEFSIRLWQLAVQHTVSARRAAEKRRVERTQRHLQVGNLHHNFEDARLWSALHVYFLKWFHLCDSCRKKDRSEAEKKNIRELMSLHIHKWVEGDHQGLVRYVVVYWHRYVKDVVAGARQQKMQELISDAKKRHEDEIHKERTNTHAAFDYAFKSWTGGTDQAIVWQVFGAWRVRAKHLSKQMGLRQSVHSALLRMMEGECRAGVQLCFTNWAHDAQVARKQKEADQSKGGFAPQTKAHLECLLAQTKEKMLELEWKLQATERRAERFHHSSEHMLRRWINHELFDLVGKVYSQWKHLAYKEVRHKLEEETRKKMKAKEYKSKLHLLKFIALMDLDPMSRTKLASMMTFWHSLSRGRKALHRQAMLEEQLEDAAKAHELALLRQRESKSFIVGAMGASSARSLLLVYITAWRAYLVQGCTKARLEHQIETSLHRACLAFHTIHEKHTKVVAMKEWNKIASEIRLERWKAELETTNGLAEHMRRLHAGPVRKKLFQLFDADNGTLVQAVFYVWKELYADIKFAHHLRKQMMGYRERQTAMGYKAVGAMVRGCSFLEVQCFVRAWQHYVAQELQAREKVLYLKLKGRSKETQDYLTLIVMSKVSIVMICAIFNAWRREITVEKELESNMHLNAKIATIRAKQQRDVAKVLILAIYERDMFRLHEAFVAFWKAVVDVTQLRNAEKMWKLLQKSDKYRLKNKADVKRMAAALALDADSVLLIWAFHRFYHVFMEEKLAREVNSEVVAELRNKRKEEKISFMVLARCLDDSMVLMLPLLFQLWFKIAGNAKDSKQILDLSTKVNKYRTRYRDNVANMLFMALADKDIIRLLLAFMALCRHAAASKEIKDLSQCALEAKKQHEEMDDIVTATVMAKALFNGVMAVAFPLIFNVWVRIAQAAKDSKLKTSLGAEIKHEKAKRQRDMGTLMLLSLLDRNDLRLQIVFRALWCAMMDARIGRCVAQKLHVQKRSRHLQDTVTYIVTLDQDLMRMYVVFSALLRGVANARAAHGDERVVQIRNTCRSRALPLGEKLVQANEARERTQALMSWKLKLSDDKKDAYASQYTTMTQKYEDSLKEREDFAARTETIKERLGIQLLISERHSDDVMADGDQLKACTTELYSEAHKQGVLLEGLEHEMMLLEAKLMGTPIGTPIKVRA